MNCLNEAIGLALPGNGTIVATNEEIQELIKLMSGEGCGCGCDSCGGGCGDNECGLSLIHIFLPAKDCWSNRHL